MDELLNQETGEVLDAREHFARAREMARDLERLDKALKHIKDEAKELKDEREAVIKQLRAHVRDVGPLGGSLRSTRKARKR